MSHVSLPEPYLIRPPVIDRHSAVSTAVAVVEGLYTIARRAIFPLAD